MKPKRGLPTLLPRRIIVQATRIQRELRHVLKRQNDFVTIGIAAPCHHGDLILMSADMRGSYADSKDTHERIGKQFDVVPGFYANIAGEPKLCNAIVSVITEALTQVKESGQRITYQHVRDAMTSAQLQELRLAYEYFVLNQIGLTRQELQVLALTNPKADRRSKALFKLTPFDVELSVCGFVFEHPLVLTMWGKQPVYPEIQFSLVGDGSEEAQKILDSRAQHAYMSIQRTIVHFSEAMTAAKAQRTVGEPADYFLIHKSGSMRRLPSEFADEFALRYRDKDTKPLDADEGAMKEVLKASYPPKFHKPGESPEGPMPDSATLDDAFKKEAKET